MLVLNCRDTILYSKEMILYPENIANGNTEHTILPNPGADYMQLWDTHGGDKTIKIYDMAGKLVYNYHSVGNELQTGLKIYTPSLKKGMYIVRIIGEGDSWENKWIKND
jgi:hypothetical protein